MESTNSLALELLSDLIPHCPALVLTENQTAGRGRGAHQWFSAAGALTFSLVVDVTNISAPRRSLISIATGVAVCHGIEQSVEGFCRDQPAFGLKLRNRQFQVKWPNDIYIDDRKLGGILTELSTNGGNATVVIGVGLNVNNSLTSLPTEVQSMATSLFDLWGQSLNLSDLIIELVDSIEQWCHQLVECPDSVVEELNRRNVLLHKRVTVDVAGEIVEGICDGVDQGGRLLVKTHSEQRRILAGSVLNWG